MKNPWHDVNIDLNKKDKTFTGVIEIPKGSSNKYELDKESGLMRLDRVLSTSTHYPANYGFIPMTYCDDKDPLDILVLSQEPILPRTLVTVRPIGMLKMLDNNEQDDKIICVHAMDPDFNSYKKIKDLPPHKIKKLKSFFENYKLLEEKEVVVDKFFDEKKAWETVLKSVEMYKKHFKGKF